MGVSQAVEAATRRWIQRFVIHERLCPFAASSRVLVRVETFGQRVGEKWRLDPLGQSEHAALALHALGRAEDEIASLITKEVTASASSNLFIVWPVGL